MTALTNNTNIQWASPFQWHYDLPDVGMNMYKVIVTKTGFLATSGLLSCFAICTRGKTEDGTPVLGMCHTSFVIAHKNIIHILKKEMVKMGCVAKTIETYVVGGGRFGTDCGESTKNEEKKALSIAKKEKIVGVKLNLTNSEDEPVHVVLTPEKIYLSKATLFESSEGNMDAGASVLEKDQSNSMET